MTALKYKIFTCISVPTKIWTGSQKKGLRDD